ncbi:ABC transporter permease [Alicyclobacillus sp. SO9]|uniref:ABC transporter permease n=1 Tax=Alicyclobacillus sp. SO9 TaxID=2665646 RepID=UPI0018E6DC14|nr:ABC transporter permease [Alicyclobacillus sp. SO9]QQE77633.1 ABC transporter permease [Alicyclobacillus sp. SO9]
MIRFVPRRTLEAVLALFGFSLIMFFALHIDHVNPARAMLGQNWTPSRGAALNRELGLDKPVFVQYLLWVRALFHVGGLGAVVKRYLVPSLVLLSVSIVVAFLASIAIAQWQIRTNGSVIDRGLSVLTGMLSAVPGFVIGSLLVVVFAIDVPWFPASSFTPPGSSLFHRVYYHVLPTTALALSVIGPWTQQLRASLGGEAKSDYVRMARSKGVSQSRVIARHMRRNALLPFVSLVGLSLPTMLNTLIAIEIIYGVQGAGYALIGSLNASLFANATTIALVFAFLNILGSMVTDFVYGLIDPRIQYH